jgi:hypothetical protein
MVTASAKIGAHFQCNIYSYVAHDCVIGDFVTFAPRGAATETSRSKTARISAPARC